MYLNATIRKILHEVDIIPGNREHPDDMTREDYTAILQEAAAIGQAIENKFVGVYSESNKGGDASYVVRLGIRKLPRETNKPEQALAAIIFSAFGKLALAHEINPLPEGMFNFMLEQLEHYDYIYIPWDAVYGVPYDGEKYRERFAGLQYTWYDRFFNNQ
jgi:hypothetical protein